MTQNFKIIGWRIKELRMQKQISQAKLAELVNMSASYISNIETAKQQPSLKSLLLISSILGVTVDTLLNGNQVNGFTEYISDISQLLIDCTSYEKRVIYEIALATKRSLLKNRSLLKK